MRVSYTSNNRFICSSNNNIARISQMVHKLCDHFSPPMLEHEYPAGSRLCATTDPDDVFVDEHETKPLTITYHPFPGPSRLAEPGVESTLRSLGFGYRAKFLAGTAQALCRAAMDTIGPDAKPEAVDRVVYQRLQDLRQLPYTEAREQLMQWPGIGPKVAEYVLRSSPQLHLANVVGPTVKYPSRPARIPVCRAMVRHPLQKVRGRGGQAARHLG